MCTHIHIDIYICIYIYAYIHTHMHLKPRLGEQFIILMPVITILNLTLGSVAITDVCFFNDPMELPSYHAKIQIRSRNCQHLTVIIQYRVLVYGAAKDCIKYESFT